ncbi:MAG: hypothetical protein WBB39_03705 [Candidatus Saccharimonadales bacterium]
MLLLSGQLRSVPIMSLQTGTEIARTHAAIIDPRKLQIVAFYVQGQLIENHPSVLFIEDIREHGNLGFIVDDSTKIMRLDNLVRLQQIINYHFELLGIRVIDRYKRKIGRVGDYSIDNKSYYIDQIHIKPSPLRRITTTSNIIHRTQIVSINNQCITIDTPDERVASNDNKLSINNFTNPFRRTQPQPDQSETD